MNTAAATPVTSHRRLYAQLLFFPLGAIVGTLGDQIHVQYHVLAYPHPFLGGQAFWVPLLFGAAGISLVNSHALAPFRPKSLEAPTTARIALAFVLFALAYFSTGLFADWPRALTVGLTLAWLLRVALDFSLDKVLIGIGLALFGPLFEAVLSSTGAFYYFHPSAFYVPIWLPALYLHVSLVTRSLYLAVLAPEAPTANR